MASGKESRRIYRRVVLYVGGKEPFIVVSMDKVHYDGVTLYDLYTDPQAVSAFDPSSKMTVMDRNVFRRLQYKPLPNAMTTVRIFCRVEDGKQKLCIFIRIYGSGFIPIYSDLIGYK
jgi:hypothetical protein